MRRWLVLWGLGAVAACGDDGPTVDPSDATAADLYGQWAKPIGVMNEGQHVFSFRESALLHPMLAGKTNVFVIYDSSPSVQIPLVMGTYRVESGVIVQTPVWAKEVGTLTNAAELRNDLLSLTKGSTLSIEGGDGLPSNYDHIDRCVVGAEPSAWRHHTTRDAVWNAVNGVGRTAMTLAYASDGALIATSANIVTRYDDECIPEVTSEETIGDSTVHGAPDGIHVITGRHMGGSAVPAAYAKLAPGTIALAPRALPIDGREMLDAIDLGGTLGILLKPAAGGLALVRDDGAAFMQTPVTNLPVAFVASQLLDAGDGRAMIFGAGNGAGGTRMFLVEEGSGGAFTSTQIPFDVPATYFAAASENGDVWIVYAASIDPGAGRARLLNLGTRRGGTWTTRPLTIGTLPELRVHGGVAHMASLAVTNGTLNAIKYYTRVDGDQVDSWIVPPALGDATGATTGIDAVPLPGIAVATDGTVAVGFQGRVQVRRPGELDARQAPVTVMITGSGRVTANGIDCTQTCTVMAEVGRRLLIKAAATNAGTVFTGCGGVGTFDPGVPTMCSLDVPAPAALTVTVQFP